MHLSIYVEHLLLEGKTHHDLSSVACNLGILTDIVCNYFPGSNIPPREGSQLHKQNNNVCKISASWSPVHLPKCR